MSSAATPAKSVVVAGDITMDRLTWTDRPATAFVDPDRDDMNWRDYERTGSIVRRGGALLLARMLQHELGDERVLSYILPRHATEQYLHSYLDLVKRIEKKKTKFDIVQLRGFGEIQPGNVVTPPDIKPPSTPQLLVLDDAGNGFRHHPDRWQHLLQPHPEWVILKMARPLARTGDDCLWDALRPHKVPKDPAGPKIEMIDDPSRISPDRLIVIINADDLRHHGMQLTPGLSWERIAQDFILHFGSVGKLGSLATLRHLIIRFGCEGAIYYRGFDDVKMVAPKLFFDPRNLEGALTPAPPGKPMIGVTVAFTAALAAAIARNSANPDMEKAIQRSLNVSRMLWQTGFVAKGEQEPPDYPMAKIFAMEESSRSWLAFKPVDIPHVMIATNRAFSWRILEDVKGSASELARRVAMQGENEALATIPVLKFGDLTTADRREIEALHTLINLTTEYLDTPGMKEPLSIAVFGRPGAGKGFVVKELANEIARRRHPDAPDRAARSNPLLVFNLSEFTKIRNLQDAFHLIRDHALSGSVPVVFFDEFDVKFEGNPGGWYKYLLAPMQDGKFREGAALHPVGRAIFVFAGGTANSYEDFIAPLQPHHEQRQTFNEVKGPDFVSRLRGHLDILGPSRVDDTDDETYVVRRAILLRARLKQRAPKLFNDKDELAIDAELLGALLSIRDFRHGARSLQAILEMSRLTDERRFTRSLLPPFRQLDLHVCAKQFLDLVDWAKLPERQRETLGQMIHQRYCQAKRREAGNDAAKHADLDKDTSMRPWVSLRENLRESNRRQADDIPRKLRCLDMYVAPLDEGRAKRVREMPHDRIDKLAEMEHERWLAERLRAGWRPGERDTARDTSPFLTPWLDLDGTTRENDRRAIRDIPELLEAIGYGIHRNRTQPL